MNHTDHVIDAAVRDALTAEVGDVHADETLLERIKHEAVQTQPRTRKSRRAPWAAAAAVALIMCGVAAAAVLGGSDDSAVTAGPADDTGEGAESSTPESLDFEVLDVQPASQPLGSLHAAVDHGGLDRLWSTVGFYADPSVDDFTRRVVVAVTVRAGGCWTEVTGVERVGSVVKVLFEEVTSGGVDTCTTTDTPRTFVIAIDREGLAPSFTLMLPANDDYGYEEQRLVVEVPSAEDGAPPELDEMSGDPTVAVTTSGLGDLAVISSRLYDSEEGWLKHGVTVENTGSETVYVNDHRQGKYLGDRELMVTDEGCGYGNVVDGRVEAGCHEEYRPLVIPPGAQVVFTVTLWVSLPGMNDLVSDSLFWRKPFRYSDAPFEQPSASHGAEGEIVFTYKHLNRVSDAVEEVTTGTVPTTGSNDDCDRPSLNQGASDGQVLVYFLCGNTWDALVARARPLPDAEFPLRAAVEALIAGPTAEEKNAGLYTFMSFKSDAELDRLSVSASVENGVATVEIRDGLDLWVPGPGTSAELFSLVDPLYYVVFQFQHIDTLDMSTNCWGEMGCGNIVSRTEFEKMEALNRSGG